MNPLHRTVPHHRGESVLSFASRLGAANGRPLHAFLGEMRLNGGALASGSEDDVGLLATLGGIEAATLMSSAIIQIGRDYEVAGQKLQKGTVPFTQARLCSACIVDDLRNGDGPHETRPYYRSAWAISLVRTCPRHRAPLVDPGTIPDGHLRQDIASTVRHGMDRLLRLADAGESVAPSGLEDYMHQRLDGNAPEGFLSSLPFYVAVRLTEMIGGMILFGKNFHSGKLSSLDWLDAGREGYAVTSGGADGIREFLSQGFGNYLQAQRNVGGKVLFGTLHTWLLQSSKKPDYDPVRELVREHVVDTLPVGPGDELLGPVTRRRWHSVHSAALEFGVHPKRLRKLLFEAGLISDADMALSDGRVLLDAEKVQGFLQSVAASLTGEDARRYVNATRVQWEIITREGFVTPMIAATDSSQAAYSRAGLDDFLTAVTYSAVPQDRTLRHLSASARSARCTLADILRLLIDRKLDEVAVSRQHKGFQGILVNPAEVKEKLPRKPSAGLSMNQAGKRMGLPGNLTRRLVAAGCIPSTSAPVPSSRFQSRIIRPEDADAFVERYVTLSEVAAEMGLGSCLRVARRMIEEKGARPAFDPDEVGARIYERSGLPK